MTDINKLSDAQYKVLENRIRRVAKRQGYQLIKSRTRDPRAVDYMGYRLAGGNGFLLGDRVSDLVEIARVLREPI
jgi:hypothetical protein